MRYHSIVILLISLFGCSSSGPLTMEELNAYVKDEKNGLIQSAEQNGYKMKVIFRPIDILVYQQIGNQQVVEEKVKAARDKYASYYYFMLNLSNDSKEALLPGGDSEQYGDLVQNLSFRMNNYVNLTTSEQDTIPVADFILDRTYGLNNATNLLFVFNKEILKEKEWVQFNLNEFGLGTGNQRFRFVTDDLENTPSINFHITEN